VAGVPVAGAAWVSTQQARPNPRARRMIDTPFTTGVRVIDGPFLCWHGSPRRPINEYLFPEDAINSPVKMQQMLRLVGFVVFGVIYSGFHLHEGEGKAIDEETESVVFGVNGCVHDSRLPSTCSNRRRSCLLLLRCQRPNAVCWCLAALHNKGWH